MAISPASGRRLRLLLIPAAAISIVVVMLATPPTVPEPPPVGQTQVAPLATPPEDPPEVLVPGDMGRVLGRFMTILEAEEDPAGDPPAVWSESPSGLSYSVKP